MRILIVCDNFTKGGLETHIYSLYEALKKDNEMFFAIGNYETELPMPEENIWNNFNFGVNASLQEFCSDVDRLIDIINEKNIDVINVHPFYALFPAIFAAHLTNTKVVYTVHGLASFNFTNFVNDTALFQYAFESSVNKVLSVNEIGVEAFRTMNYENVSLLPNGINGVVFKETKINSNKSWALLSRLEVDKVNEIKKFFDILPELDIKKIDIYGDGSCRKELEDYVSKLNLNIEFKGHTDNVSEALLDKYTGIIGTGRVALEGMCMNYPVILIGYGKICGMITEDIYNKVSSYNFVTKTLNEISLIDLKNQVIKVNTGDFSKYMLREIVLKDRDINIISKKYLNELNDTRFYVQNNMIDLYNDIKKLMKSGDANFNFYKSTNVFYLLKNYVEHFSKNIVLKNLFVACSKQFEIERTVMELENKLNSFESNNDNIE